MQKHKLLEVKTNGKKKIPVVSVHTVVVGSGAAGLNAAVQLKLNSVDDVAIVTEGLGKGTSINTGSDKQTYYKLAIYGKDTDAPALMAESYFAGGSMHGDLALIEAALSVRAFMNLVNLGVPFPRDKYGQFVGYKTDHDPRQRATSIGPYTSREMCRALIKKVKELKIPVYENRNAVELLVIEEKGAKRAGGVIVVNEKGNFEIFEADKVPADIFSNPIYKTEKIVFRKFDSKASYTFTMGSPEKEVGRMSNEPQHEVTISQNLYVAIYEITQAQYRNVTGLNPSYYQGDTRPVEQVTWEDVRGGDWPGDPAGSGLPAQGTFLDLLSSKSKLECDLPTEAQWEMICRSTTSTALNSGQNLSNTNQCPEADEVGWYVGNVSNGQHREVGQKLPNYKGLFDMHGNVWELCLDWYVKDIGTAAVTDPLGPSSGSLRALRGGGWINYAGSIRSARRSYIGPRDYFNYAGFRPVIRAYNISGTVTGTVSKSVNFSLSGISNMKTTSDTNGAYAFYGLVKGNYTVTPSLQGYLFEPESIAVEIIKEDVKDVNFVSTGSKFSISGKITGEVLAGVTVKAEGTMVGYAVSSEDGTYKISGLISGNYTVTPTLQGYIFEPSSQNVSIYGTDVKDVNFNAKIK
ncbi:MAG: SUMF1/EgtB/PvdO family nonheme iron enzyme [Candidatus Nanoarchaeia archaeon]